MYQWRISTNRVYITGAGPSALIHACTPVYTKMEVSSQRRNEYGIQVVSDDISRISVWITSVAMYHVLDACVCGGAYRVCINVVSYSKTDRVVSHAYLVTYHMCVSGAFRCAYHVCMYHTVSYSYRSCRITWPLTQWYYMIHMLILNMIHEIWHSDTKSVIRVIPLWYAERIKNTWAVSMCIMWYERIMWYIHWYASAVVIHIVSSVWYSWYDTDILYRERRWYVQRKECVPRSKAELCIRFSPTQNLRTPGLPRRITDFICKNKYSGKYRA